MEAIADRSAAAKRSLEGQGQSSQFWLLGETVNYIWKHSVTTINEQLGPEFWNRFRKIAEDVGCKVSVHNRKSLKNVHGGWGHYSLTIMGRHRSRLYKQLCDRLQDAGLHNDEEAPPARNGRGGLRSVLETGTRRHAAHQETFLTLRPGPGGETPARPPTKARVLTLLPNRSVRSERAPPPGR